MIKLQRLRLILPLSFLLLLFCFCASGYQAAPAQDDEPDLLAALFGGDDESEATPATQTLTPATDTKSPLKQTPSTTRTPATAAKKLSTPASAALTPPATQTAATTPLTITDEQKSEPVRDVSALECKVVVLDENKLPYQNRLMVKLGSYVRLTTAENAKWQPLAGARLETDSRLIETTSLSPLSDKYGSIELTMMPWDANEFFSFVPLTATGLRTPDFSVPIEALSLRTVTLYYFSQNKLLCKFPYSFQTYNLLSVIQAFVQKTLNLHIRQVRIKIIDIDSQYPIHNAEVTIIGQPPTPRRLLENYFPEHRQLNYAVDVSPHYVLDIEKATTNHYGAAFSLYHPFTYRLQITHPDYFYTSRELEIAENDQVITVMISKLHTKVEIIKNEQLTPRLK